MKKLTIILIAMCITMMAQGQWYANQYGVTNMNELNKAQLEMSLEQATKLKNAGIATTVITTAFAVIGTAVYIGGLNDITSSTTYSGIDDGASKAYSGVGLMTVGYIGMCVGIPLWISGAQRSNTVKVHLAKFDQLGYQKTMYGAGVTLTF